MSKFFPVPKHLAIIMDGNGRWAQQRHMPRKLGHYRGAARVRSLIEYCTHKGVQCLTLFAFSTENWQRSAEEVEALMALFIDYLDKELPSIIENQIRFRVIGSMDRFPLELRQRIESAEKKSAHHKGLMLNIAANYGGRWEILHALQSWQASNPDDTLDSLTQDKLGEYLMTAGQPELDLLIRTGGESRISNFLLWQAAYAELYFTDTLWPDFDETELQAAFEWFALRDRRFGGIKDK